MSWAKGKRGHSTFACSCVADHGPDSEFEAHARHGGSLLVFSPVSGLLLWTHPEKKRVPFLCPHALINPFSVIFSVARAYIGAI